MQNPIGDKVQCGDGWSYQVIRLGCIKNLNRGYVKIFHNGELVDRAVTVKAAREIVGRRRALAAK